MQARMKNPGVAIPDAMTAIRALNEAIKQGGVPSSSPRGKGALPVRVMCPKPLPP